MIAACAAAFCHNPIFNRQQPFVCCAVRPGAAIPGAGKFPVKDRRIADNLIAVQNDRVVQVFTRDIEGCDVITLRIPWIFYQSNAVVLLCPFIELLFEVSDHDVDLMDSIFVKRCDDRIDHAHTIDSDQRFWGR